MTYLWQQTFPYFTNLPTDVATNTFHFNWLGGAAPATADWTALNVAVQAFYTAIFNNVGGQQMAGCILAQCTAKAYNLDDPIPRPPVYMNTAVPSPVTDPLFSTPMEVALCLSMQGKKVAGVDQASRRGRIFLGPFGDIVAGVPGSPTSFPGPGTTFVTNIATAAHNLTVATIGASWQWVVYSRKLGSSTPVINGWIDNAWDTQRRRGNKTTARTTWTAFLP